MTLEKLTEMGNEISELTINALSRIIQANDQMIRKLLKIAGLTLSQFQILRALQCSTEMTPSELAATLQYSQATITYIVDQLSALGYVTRQRSEKDKRQIILRISDLGRSTLASELDLSQQPFFHRYETLPSWEQLMILTALERICFLLDSTEIDTKPPTR